MRANTTRKRDARITPRKPASVTKSRPHSSSAKSAKAPDGQTSAATESVQTKTCVECGEEKAAASFLPSKFTADHLTDRCRTCTYGQAEKDRREREARKCEAEARKATRTPAPAGVVTKKCKGCSVAKPLDQYARQRRSCNLNR